MSVWQMHPAKITVLRTRNIFNPWVVADTNLLGNIVVLNGDKGIHFLWSMIRKWLSDTLRIGSSMRGIQRVMLAEAIKGVENEKNSNIHCCRSNDVDWLRKLLFL